MTIGQAEGANFTSLHGVERSVLRCQPVASLRSLSDNIFNFNFAYGGLYIAANGTPGQQLLGNAFSQDYALGGTGGGAAEGGALYLARGVTTYRLNRFSSNSAGDDDPFNSCPINPSLYTSDPKCYRQPRARARDCSAQV